MLTTCNSTSSTITTNDDVSTTPQFDTLSNSTESIDILPDELKLEILKNLSQYEYVNLLRVSKSWHRLVFPLLYDHIIIDANFSTFNNICPLIGRSYLHSSYNVKSFIKTINTMKQVPRITKFDVVDLPYSLGIQDESTRIFVKLFQKLTDLNELVWLDDNFRFEFLINLPNKPKVNTLILNITHDTYSNAKFCESKKLNFTNLKNFQIIPFMDCDRLLKIINNMVINVNDPKVIGQNLESLVLSGTIKHDVSYNQIIENTINVFNKSKITYLDNLSVLSLENLRIMEDDANTLIKSINLKHLKTLHLQGILGVTDSTFFETITPYLTNLQILSVHITESESRKVLEFISDLPTRLQELDVTLFASTFHHMETYINPIIRHNTLSKLSLEIPSWPQTAPHQSIKRSTKTSEKPTPSSLSRCIMSSSTPGGDIWWKGTLGTSVGGVWWVCIEIY
ncbi:uncharacterized protein J8A68_002157 [[Candida] subhashii]|uniref:F-box domain-containing protein n=1 Tax=[Candida] subhashii TaxID=561895 RepID=A0A8J5QML8_9ASCO|nr:uncharacterized protein J8A68_002157 [[Candida] subhashii]KAG7664299.1 hypothetical protein J8A68_002157 [[Candida] subhashii]